MESEEQQDIAIAFLTLIIAVFFSAIGAGISKAVFSEYSVLPGVFTGLLLSIFSVKFLVKNLKIKGLF